MIGFLWYDRATIKISPTKILPVNYWRLLRSVKVLKQRMESIPPVQNMMSNKFLGYSRQLSKTFLQEGMIQQRGFIMAKVDPGPFMIRGIKVLSDTFDHATIPGRTTESGAFQQINDVSSGYWLHWKKRPKIFVEYSTVILLGQISIPRSEVGCY